ncbi:hypothetical protein JGY68_002139 [Salmonella enterica]|nr:hypothetical protein [Salmonella enterica]EGH5309440.1 hypothetical protein [Salmonella enterica]EGW8385396.1 hypothetical protein [Salmonella enterica]EHL2428941.1 hypothetical protein [Salmonella enterica]EHO4317628.1 hypothetical protein [Salmonella enterica]
MNNKLTDERLMQIADAAEAVLSALAGTNDDVHPESSDMIRLWDELNDDFATPEAVRNMAIELQERRKADGENLVKERQRVIDGLCTIGETAWEIEEYMKKWDAEHAALQPALQPSVGFVDATGTDCECVCPVCKHEFSIQFEY